MTHYLRSGACVGSRPLGLTKGVELAVIGALIFLVMGIFQWMATYDGLVHWVGLHWLLAGALSLFLGYFPLVGSILGFLGATKVWGWEWWQAALLYFGIPAVGLAIGGASLVAEWFQRRRFS